MEILMENAGKSSVESRMKSPMAWKRTAHWVTLGQRDTIVHTFGVLQTDSAFVLAAGRDCSESSFLPERLGTRYEYPLV